MPSQSTFRVFGDVLDREESYLDISVSGVDTDGNIYLEESGADGETWSFTPEEIREFHEELLLVGDNDIPFQDHAIWTDLDSIGNTRAEVDINQFVDEYLLESQRNLFKAIIEAGR
jgi:hypothetical protein